MTEFTPIDGDAHRQVVDLSAAFSKPFEIMDEHGNLATVLHVLPAGYRIEASDLTRYHPHPTRKSGGVTLWEAESFVAYVRTHGEPGTTLYVDPTAGRIKAILNAATSARPGWQDHTATLHLQKTPEWVRWAEANGKWQTQEQFAEFVNDSLPEFAAPPGAHMLEVAQTFEAKSGVDFQSGTRLDNGERRFVYKETIAAKAGQAGELTVPEALTLRLRPFKGGPGYNAKARLRYRIQNGTLNLMVKIERVEDFIDHAFAETCKGIEEQLAETIDNLLLVHGTDRA